jgi:hypothetical protein
VAITRAQSLLIIVGNPNVLWADDQWRVFLTWLQSVNACIGVPIPGTQKSGYDVHQEIERRLASLDVNEEEGIEEEEEVFRSQQEWRNEL